MQDLFSTHQERVLTIFRTFRILPDTADALLTPDIKNCPIQRSSVKNVTLRKIVLAFLLTATYNDGG